MKDKLNNKIAVSRSPAMNCSADGQKACAERKTSDVRTVKILNEFIASDSHDFEHFGFQIESQIREAVEAEREACLQIAKDYNELEAREFMSVYHAERVSDAISLNRK